MRIAVCIKTVVDPQARIELDGEGRLCRQHLRLEVNEYDLYAVEEALRLAESTQGQVLVVTLGSDGAVQGLRKGLAMGADSAMHIECAPELVDAAGTAKLLAAALRRDLPDLVLTGVESDDLGGAQVGVLLAEELDFASTTLVVGASAPEHGAMKLRRELEGGDYAAIEIDLPAVLGIQSGINEPRYPSLKGIMAAKRKELTTLTPAELGFDPLPSRRVESLGLMLPPARRRARIIEGTVDEAVAELVRILREEEKVL